MKYSLTSIDFWCYNNKFCITLILFVPIIHMCLCLTPRQQHDTHTLSLGSSNILVDDTIVSNSMNSGNSFHSRCEPITIPFCMGIAYNQTVMPNLLGQQRQDEAGFEVQQYYPLVKIRCSNDLQFFLCSVFAPVCTIIERPLPPCRSLCISARNGCEAIMNRFQIEWPDNLECSKFPEPAEQLCVGENNYTETATVQATLNNVGQQSIHSILIDTNGKDSTVDSGSGMRRHFSGSGGSQNSIVGSIYDIGFVCPEQFRMETSIGNQGYNFGSKKKGSSSSERTLNSFYTGGYSLRIGNRQVKDCGAPCDAFWTREQTRASRNWVAAWSVLCCASCLFTSLTFAIDTHRFRYPERPIIFLSLCYLMVSISYLIGWMAGDSVACNKRNLIIQGTNSGPRSSDTDGGSSELCVVLFMVSYFFGTASSVWWVVLTLTWYLAAGLKWGHEAIEANSHYFHLAAWTVPAAKTITVLAMGKIEGDVLTGICSMAVWSDDTAVRDMILIPLVVYLVLGTAFWMAGFVALCRIRTVMKHDGTRGTEKLEKLMIRIGVFSVLYTVPALAQILCLAYEHVYRESWLHMWHTQLCHDPKYAIPCPSQNDHDQNYSVVSNGPNFEIFVAKYFVSLLVGLTSSVWIWSGKTVNSWRNFFARLRSKRHEPSNNVLVGTHGKSEAYV
ncbi:frizzled-7-A-like [Daktulosphaira vitifoliae]|uniref:frizzled-7-A-like n=1 Tax=Daktulosphaira vitifoliae TaxID=58002 RepID=UPI0021A997D1|nr:frizzled-7-A-like [Daktulosphaira vitifoliae]